MGLLSSIAAALSEGVGNGMMANAKWGIAEDEQAKKEAADNARLKEQLKRYDLDRQSRELVNPQGMSCVLAAREFMLLELLANNTGKIVSRRSIVDAFGENWLDFDLRTLDTLVSRLRRRWHGPVRPWRAR